MTARKVISRDAGTGHQVLDELVAGDIPDLSATYDIAGAAAAAAAASQPLDSDLTAIAALSTTSFGRSLLALADAAALRIAAALVIGTDVQAYDAELAALAGLTSAADKAPYFTGSGTATLADLTAAGRALIDDADAAAQRATLGLGALAVLGSLAHSATTGQTADDHHAQAHDHSAAGAGQSLAPASTFALTGDITPTTITGQTDDWNPTGLSTAAVIRASTSATWDINGLAGGSDGRVLVLINVGAENIGLGHEIGTSTAANRFSLPGGDRFILQVNTAVVLVYDATRSRWAVVGIPYVFGASATTQAFGDAATGGATLRWAKEGHKHAMPTLGYGLSGNSSPAVGLSTASGLTTAETTISAATYADITGASVSLVAGTWILIGHLNARSVNARAQIHLAITDGSNTIVREGSGSVPASGTASVNDYGHVTVSAIVSPGSTTTYKLRGARGNTTLTNSWIAVDGSGQGVANNASSNTNVGTGLIAVRIA